MLVGIAGRSLAVGVDVERHDVLVVGARGPVVEPHVRGEGLRVVADRDPRDVGCVAAFRRVGEDDRAAGGGRHGGDEGERENDRGWCDTAKLHDFWQRQR